MKGVGSVLKPLHIHSAQSSAPYLPGQTVPSLALLLSPCHRAAIKAIATCLHKATESSASVVRILSEFDSSGSS